MYYIIYRKDKLEAEEYTKYIQIMYIVTNEDKANEFVKKLNELEKIADMVFNYTSTWHWELIEEISEDFKEPFYIQKARDILNKE